MSIWRFADRFSTTSPADRISLGEGNTPFVRSRRIGPTVGAPNLWFKIEGGNPSGSYKDRFAAAAVSDMVEKGKRLCLATSSGNTGAALAAYCAAAGIACEIAAVDTAPPEKLKQMAVYGAKVYRVRGFGSDPAITPATFDRIRQRAEQPGSSLQISAYAYSPIGMAGVQTIGYELLEQSEGTLNHVFVPAGGGGLTLAVARGVAAANVAVHCVQPEGNNTIAGPLRAGADRATSVQCTTRISGLQVASVIDGHDVIAACRRSGGTGYVVTDTDVWAMQTRLAKEEGIFCEPASAVAVVGALQAIAAGEIGRDSHIACIVTGVGFKDAPSVDRMLTGIPSPIIELADV